MLKNVIYSAEAYILKKPSNFYSSRKETGLELNGGKTRYIVISRVLNAGPSHNIQIENRTFESVKHFIYGKNSNKSKFYSGRS